MTDPIGVIGLDLSLTATGVVRPSGVGFTIKTKAKDKDRRLEEIYSTLLLSLHGVSHAVLEDLPYNAMQAGTTGMVQGVARLALMKREVRYAFLSPATLKKFATNNGRSDKADMASALLEYLGNPLVVVDPKGRQFIPEAGLDLSDDNQVDAAWLRIAGLTRLGIDTQLAHRASRLDTGKWQNWDT